MPTCRAPLDVSVSSHLHVIVSVRPGWIFTLNCRRLIQDANLNLVRTRLQIDDPHIPNHTDVVAVHEHLRVGGRPLNPQAAVAGDDRAPGTTAV